MLLKQMCSDCAGTGFRIDKGWDKRYDCDTCHATGFVMVPDEQERIAIALERIAASLESLDKDGIAVYVR